MKQTFIKKEGHPRLMLFFAGWGSEENLFRRPVEEGYDYLLCFDYRTLDFDYTQIEGYTEIRLLAWSMGVWVASRVFTGHSFPWQMKLAVNGTPFPIDDRRGIPKMIFKGTLEHFSEDTLARFRRRMCGSSGQTEEFLSRTPTRTAEELREELAALAQGITAYGSSSFIWDRAIIGNRDKIFPPRNQHEAWQGTEIMETEAEHYETSLFSRLLEGKGEEWTRH